MTLRYLFLSHPGRINRARWLVATIALDIGSRLVSGIAAGFLSGPTGNLLVSILELNLWFVPAYALAAKRFQDRGKSGRTALYGLIPMQAARLVWQWAFIPLPLEPSALMWLCALVEWGPALWFLIELGMLKGVPGPNRFGGDPLDPVAMRQSVEQERIIENDVFAYTVCAAGVVIMVAICNTLMWMLSVPESFLLSVLIRGAEGGEALSLAFRFGVWLTAVGFALIGFFFAAPFTRLSLRIWPVDPFAGRTIRFWVILSVGAICFIPVSAFFGLTLVGISNYAAKSAFEGLSRDWRNETELQQAVVRCGWSSVLLGVLGFFYWTHFRTTRLIKGPFVLFLRRFSSFADRSLVVDMIKSMPRDVRLVFIASRADHARNWDPFVWALGGLRLFRPFKNLPIQIRTSDEAWIENVGELVRRARAIVVDLSARSPSIEVEQRLIDEKGARERVLVLAEERDATRMRHDEVPESAIRYSPSFMNSAVWSFVKVGSVLALWYLNPEHLWGWLALLTLPFLVMPSVSRATRRAMREAIRSRVERVRTPGQRRHLDGSATVDEK